ncbi:hypothetical protein EG68_07848 [Paragonimus skrjabini miyazakii]|uniref:Uncharacterized protein n=1 Tax=Paragonimus skrjabini miyazakii TaxID=59628 RepID=A0A8S9YVW2_9TREM|nr:hypothetical protein EG68_07848 [Paragonimus skrjabini miyazakii]
MKVFQEIHEHYSVRPETYGEARAHVSEAIMDSNGVASDATVPMTYRPKCFIDTPPEENSAALAEYHIIDVNLPPNHQLINTSSPVISPRLIQPIVLRPHSVLTEQRLFSPIHIPSLLSHNPSLRRLHVRHRHSAMTSIINNCCPQ